MEASLEQQIELARNAWREEFGDGADDHFDAALSDGLKAELETISGRDVQADMNAAAVRDLTRRHITTARPAVEGAKALAQFEADARERFIQAGGSEADFTKAWPAMKGAYLSERATENSHAERLSVTAVTWR